MTTLSGLPYAEAQFDRDQQPVDPDQTATLTAWVGTEALTDLLVLAHGWNNDMDDARALYAELVGNVVARRAAGSGGGLPGRTLGVLGIFWPSKKFADDDLIPGGAASAGGDLEEAALETQLDDLTGFFDAPAADATLATLKQQVPDLEHDPTARNRFLRDARTLFGSEADLDPDDRQEIPDFLFTAESEDETEELFRELKKPDPPGMSTVTTSSGAAGLSLGGFRAGARRLLNYITYYQMKKRARQTGVDGVQPLVRALRDTHRALRIHLVGHSFGGLLVTSVAWGGGQTPAIPVETLTLLQAAFSHNGFAERFHDGRNGRYRDVLLQQRVTGPIVCTHTQNDRSVGLAYALASRFSRQDSAAIGGPDDRFGGIGANGAQHTPEASVGALESPGTPYRFRAGALHNLLADDHIRDHSDVRGAAVAHAIVETVGSV